MGTAEVIRVGNCQFAVGPDPRANCRTMRRQMERGAAAGAELLHFPEAALSGYAGVDFESFDGYDWALLADQTAAICDAAKRLGVWVVFGSAHYLDDAHLPTNCVYVVNPEGRLVERYDKRFCTTGDVRTYTPGTHLGGFEVNGVTCGLLICYDVRFPELARAYRALGAKVIFHSFYNARAKGPNIHTVIMRQSVQVAAATNYFWVSATNASGHYQTWPGAILRPDGSVERSHRRNHPGVITTTIDTTVTYYDASAPYRDRAMAGILSSDSPPPHPRRSDRTSF